MIGDIPFNIDGIGSVNLFRICTGIFQLPLLQFRAIAVLNGSDLLFDVKNPRAKPRPSEMTIITRRSSNGAGE